MMLWTEEKKKAMSEEENQEKPMREQTNHLLRIGILKSRYNHIHCRSPWTVHIENSPAVIDANFRTRKNETKERTRTWKALQPPQ
jgi:hypothetical protein